MKKITYAKLLYEYSQGFTHFQKFVAGIPPNQRVSFDELLDFIKEIEDMTLEKNSLHWRGLLPEYESIYAVVVTLMVRWYPRFLSYGQVESFHFWALSDHLRLFIENEKDNFTLAKAMAKEGDIQHPTLLHDEQTEKFLNQLKAA